MMSDDRLHAAKIIEPSNDNIARPNFRVLHPSY